ncbi:hypothetical protein NQ176_g7828 [Zarea fungicola]|uniref:Uncharacterized protein n=1 Tax=Zarea fungicola TaxID=93591 RepID=A0ACC1MY71_9HYPO|nr:hypothetical protein NQ176_g7828 [Lecanicillium fungicola]
MTSNNHIAIIGAGVIGLSIALQLARRGYRVTIIARELPGDWDIDYASPRAGAHFRPVPVKTAQDAFENQLMRETYEELKRVADDANTRSAGVDFIPAVEYFDTALGEEDLAMFSAWPGYRLLGPSELPSSDTASSVKTGLTYSAWVINSPIYLKWLQHEAELLGAVFLRARLVAIPEAAFVAQQHRPDLLPPKTVVNASGMGFGDPDCFPSRGQFMLVSNEYSRTVSHHSADGHSTVIIPRPLGGGCVVGGTKEPNNWSRSNSKSAVEEILRRIETICPDLPQRSTDHGSKPPSIHVQEAYIGRRPMRRGGLRLEKETIEILSTADDGLTNNKSTLDIVHCYGAGPSGYKIGWAAASRAADLVERE